jgi:SAM-dependent methyltransferase
MSQEQQQTIEYFIPRLGLELEPYLACENKQGIHHLARYHWAKLVVKPGRVIDIACGAGYGTLILAEHCCDVHVLGVDYDERAIRLAKERFSHARVSHRSGDLVAWKDSEGTPLGSFDTVISFDTIEHLHHRELALINIAENLAEDGVLMFSTPCGHTEPKLNPPWEHHKIEYSFHYLRNLLLRFFKEVLEPADPGFPHADFWSEVVNGSKARYLNRMNPLLCRGPIRVGLG